jgi:hypothetical protein
MHTANADIIELSFRLDFSDQEVLKCEAVSAVEYYRLLVSSKFARLKKGDRIHRNGALSERA